MKKTMIKLLNAITVVAMVLVMALSVVAFTVTNGNAADNNANNATNVNSSTNVSDNQNNSASNPETKVDSVSGIYSFNYDLSFNDIYYENEQELLDYFRPGPTSPIDLNGVYNAVKPLGFEEFLDEISMSAENFRAIYFNEGTAQMLVKNNDGFYTIESGEAYPSSNFEFTVNEDETISTNIEYLKVEFDKETNTPTLYYQFIYTDSEGAVQATPLYVKVSLENVFNSVNALEGKEYKFEMRATSIVTTSLISGKIEEQWTNLANMLNITAKEGQTDKAAVFESFDSCTLLLADDATRIVVKVGNKFAISYSTAVNTFAWNDATAKLSLQASGVDGITLNFTIQINEQYTFIIAYLNMD